MRARTPAGVIRLAMRTTPLVALVLLGCSASWKARAEKPPAEELSQEDIQGTILEHRVELRACAKEQLERDPSSGGKAVVQFHIRQSGEASEVDVRGDAPAELARCLKGVFAAMHFRAHKSDPELVIWPMRY